MDNLKKEEKNEKSSNYFIWKYLLFPLVVAILTFCVSNGVVSNQQTRATKIQVISDLTEGFADYYFYFQVRSMIYFEQDKLGKYYIDTTTIEVQSNRLPIGKALELQELLSKTYPTSYGLMLERETKTSIFTKNLFLAQIYFSDNIRTRVQSFSSNYFPIEGAIQRKVNQKNSKIENIELSEQEKNSILEEVFNELQSDFFELLNQMNRER